MKVAHFLSCPDLILESEIWKSTKWLIKKSTIYFGNYPLIILLHYFYNVFFLTFTKHVCVKLINVIVNYKCRINNFCLSAIYVYLNAIIDVVLVNGVLREGDEIVVCGFQVSSRTLLLAWSNYHGNFCLTYDACAGTNSYHNPVIIDSSSYEGTQSKGDGLSYSVQAFFLVLRVPFLKSYSL